MASRWIVLLATCIGAGFCSALSNGTNRSTTTTSSSTLVSSKIDFESTSISDQHTEASSHGSSSSSSEARLGSFILHGLGVTLSASTASSLPSSTTDSSTSFSFSRPAVNATALTQKIASNTSTRSLEDALSCNSASLSWLSAQTSESSTSNSTSIWTTTIVSSTPITPNGTVYTLCDHYPRMDVKPTALVSTSMTVLTTYIVKTLPPTCTSNCPPCSIGEKDCSNLWYSWASYTGTTHISAVSPACPSPTETSSNACPTPLVGPPDCFFTAGPVRLVYFPPEIKGNRLCGNYTTVPSNATTPVTVETFGTTFTSGTAYISFENLAAVDLCGIPTGTGMKNLFLPLPSSKVSSMCGANNGVFITGPTSTALNFADLQTPIASDVYKCQPKCIWGGPMWSNQCPTIFDDFAPALAYPTQVKQLQPEWTKCWFRADEYFRYQYGQQYYLFDPPLALTQANSEDGVTVPNAPTPAPLPPSPAVGEHSSAVPKTTAPKTTAQATIDPTATSPAGNPPSPTQDPDTPPPQPNKSNTQAIEQPTKQPSPVTDPSNTASANDPSPPPQSNAPAKMTPAELPSDALGVFSNALSTVPGHDINTAGPKPAQATPSGHSDNPISAAADSSQAQGLVVGGSVTIPIFYGQATSIDIPEADPVAVSRQGSAYVVAGQTLTPGQAATVQGQAISVILPQSAGAAPAATIAPGLVDVSREGSNYIVNGETITPGQVATVGGHTISLDPEANGLVLESSTLSLQPGASTAFSPPEVISGMGISRSGSVYIVDGTALAPGQSVIINGQTMSEDSAGQRLIVDTESVSLDDGAATTLAVKPATPSELEISRSGSAIIVDGMTLSPGVVSVVVGQTVSALPNGEGVLLGSQTVSLDDGAATTITPALMGPAQLTISRSGSSVIVDGVRIAPGASTIVDGQTVSALSSGDGVVVGSRTITLSDGEATTATVRASLSAEGLVTIGSKTLTAYGVPGHSNQVLVDGKTLTSGGAPLTTDGETLSLGSKGLVAVSHGRTSTVALTGSTATTITSPTPTTAVRVTSQPVSATTTSDGHRQDSRWVLRVSLTCCMAICATLFA